ncbi:lysine--tRNA ligase [Anaplasma bovis]|uniref:lysine--tRNA ligase n=1 Tax=Anaplasma bovis TaxID=186733 RepID=UPI002FF17F4D
MPELISWPFVEAEKILQTFGEGGEVILATGYGPSGLPHIGTFGEVLRTVFVANAIKKISPKTKPRILAFSDDMDGLRKVPDNIPNGEMVSKHLGKLLTSIPDPFGTHESYGHHMNNRFCTFLDRFEFEYEFMSSTECYRSGRYDEVLLRLLKSYEDSIRILLPTLGEERQQTYSPFLPLCPKTKRVLQVPIVETHVDRGTVSYRDPDDGSLVEVPVTGGHCKLQWKADWGMRWAAFGVQYESHGKDLTPSAKPASEICRLLGGKEPILFPYELFLDREGKKISKSKGNGLSVDEWLSCAPYESLALYMFQNPKRAKRLCLDVVPKFVDDYFSLVRDYNANSSMDNPVWHIHNGNVPEITLHGLSFSLLINIASACNAEDTEMLWKLLKKYRSSLVGEESNEVISKLVHCAVSYYKTFILPHRSYRTPSEHEADALLDLINVLHSMHDDVSSDGIQNEVFAVGKKYFSSNLREWFKMLYEVLLGQSDGPRFGSFVKVYGIENTITLIKNSLEKSGHLTD